VNYRFLNDNVFWQNFEIHRYSSELGFRIHHLSASNVHNRNVKIMVELNISLFKGKLTCTAILVNKRKDSLKISKSPEKPQRFFKRLRAQGYKYIKKLVLDKQTLHTILTF
jgi:hypothetical protein